MAFLTDCGRRIVRGVEAVTTVALAVMVVLVCGLVGLRGLPAEHISPGAADLKRQVLSRYTSVSQLLPVMLCWLTFLGVMLADRRGEHLGNDILLGLLPERPRRVVRLAVRCVWIAFFALLTVLGFAQVARGESLGDLAGLGLPAWSLQLGLPVGAALVGVFAVGRLIRDLQTSTPLVPPPRRAGGGPA